MEGLLYVVSNEWIINPKTGKMPYKIGITTKTVDERYYGLGLKMPGTFKTLVAYLFDDCTEAERLIQGLFKKYCVNGEWFEINDDQIELLRKNCDNMGGKPATEEIENEVKNETEYDETDETQEIKKIERRINRWFPNREQTNSKILYAFIKIYKQNNGTVTYEQLKKEANIENEKFKGNFDQMKNFGRKNHGKIFEQTGDNIKLWEKVEHIILEKAKEYGV